MARRAIAADWRQQNRTLVMPVTVGIGWLSPKETKGAKARQERDRRSGEFTYL